MLGILAGRVTAIDSSGFDVALRCRVENPNLLGAEVRDLRFRVSTDGFLLGEGRVPGLVKEVHAKSRFVLEVPLRVSYARLPKDLPQRTAKGRLRMRTEVWFEAKTRLGTYDMHLVSVDHADIDKALSVGIQGVFRGDALRIERIAVRSVGLLRMSIGFTATARNRFPFPLKIRRADYALSINGDHFGDGELKRELRLAAGAKTSLDLSVSATHASVVRALAALATTDPRFRVKGTVWVDPIAGISKLPIDITADSSVFAR